MTDYTHDIERYRKGEMSPVERHALEKKALDDPFLAEALEGAEELTADQFAQDVQSLNSRILAQKPVKTLPLTWTLRIAAGLVVLLLSTYVIWNLSQSVVQEKPLALKNGTDTDSATAEEDLLITENDTMTATEDVVTPATRLSPSAGKPVPEKSEAEKDVIQEADLLTEPVTTPVRPLEMPVTLEVQPKVGDKKEELVKPVEVAVSRDEADDARKKQAVSRVSGVATNVTPAGTRVISGKVTSAEDGTPLPGVNVIIKGSNRGAISDASGNYQLTLTDLQPTLVFSFIGLQSTEVPVGDRHEVDVQMNLDVAQLSEVVVVGLGTPSTGYVTPTVNLAHPETGNRAFKQYLETNIHYPQEAILNKTEGRVTIEFIVEKDGTLNDFTILRGIGSGCDEELIRLIKEGPTWVPTTKDGVPVRDKARVRLKFTLPK